MGITRASHGEVSLFGERLAAHDPRRKRSIGYVAQEQAYYDWMTATSIGRFVAGFYPTWDDAEYARLLALLEVPRQRRIGGFSGGMRAKLALALALAHRPRLLLLDEPTAGMDAVARREFIEIVRDNAQRTHRTTVFSSHFIDEVEIAADRLGIVHDGHMLYEGDAQSLLQRVLTVSRPLEDGNKPVMVGVDVLPQPGLRVLQDRIRAGERALTVVVDEPADLGRLDLRGWTPSSRRPRRRVRRDGREAGQPVTRPLRALLRKELTQHGPALWALAVLLGLAFVIEWWQLGLRDRVLSQLELASTFALVPLSLAALYLGHRLVVQEYYASTQRFVENAPGQPRPDGAGEVPARLRLPARGSRCCARRQHRTRR